MYNRYVPQSDGSYRRSRMEDQSQRQQRSEPPAKPMPAPVACEEQPAPKPHHPNQNVGGFFKHLLPPNFDTGDLIIMLLLLLLAGDCEEDKTTAMLTLVLYLFM